MLVIIPIVVVLAGVALLYTRRRYKASKSKESRVVVKGHTFSESVEQKPATEVGKAMIDNVRQCCVVGAGGVGAITGIVLALQNPEVQFCIADSDKRMIDAWNSDSLPLYEPGVEEALFDDQSLSVKDITVASTTTEQPDSNGKYTYTNIDTADHVQRRRKLSNLTFSTNVHAAVVAAELIFLCVEMERGGFNESPVNHTYLNPTLQTIAHASTGHKIIVQRTAAPYGATQYIKNYLNQTSSPRTTFTILTTPDFTLPGSTFSDTIHPQRVIIGHIFSPDASTESSITALKRLYTPWVPEERISTMDAWSAELGRIASKAAIAQRVVEAEAVRMLCAGTEASAVNVGWMLGGGFGLDGEGEGGMGMGMGIGWLRSDVKYFVGLAGELGMGEVEGYWRGVLRMDEVLYRRTVEGLVKSLPGKGDRKVAVVGIERKDTAVLFEELRKSGATIRVWDGAASKEQVRDMSDVEDADIMVAGSLEDACSGCSAVVVNGHSGIGDGAWQAMAAQMEEPKMLLDTAGGLDRARVRQLGLRIL